MDGMKSSYPSSNYSSSYGGGYSSSGSGYGGSSLSSYGGMGGGSASAGSGGYTQTKKNVVIKMIETKDGKVVSESSEVIED